VVFYAGWPFLAGAWRELRHRAPGMDTLVAVAALLAYGASLVETLRGGPHVWYDAAVMFVFLLLVARSSSRARRQANRRGTHRHAGAGAAGAGLRERDDGRTESGAVAAARRRRAARAGRRGVPADGVLLDAGAFDEACSPASRAGGAQAGDAVFAGSLCARAAARLRVLRTGSGTRLSQLTRLVERAQGSGRGSRASPTAWRRASSSRCWSPRGVFAVVADRPVARLRGDAGAAGGQLPLRAVAGGAGRARRGARRAGAARRARARADALETLARVTDVVFDKTGTLTDGHRGSGSRPGNTGRGRRSPGSASRRAAAPRRRRRHRRAARRSASPCISAAVTRAGAWRAFAAQLGIEHGGRPAVAGGQARRTVRALQRAAASWRWSATGSTMRRCWPAPTSRSRCPTARAGAARRGHRAAAHRRWRASARPSCSRAARGA
jgi:P-type Cu2+ transporter